MRIVVPRLSSPPEVLRRILRPAVLFVIANIFFWLYRLCFAGALGETAEAKITFKEIQFLVLNLLGGISLLIYGIHLMGEGLQKAAGERMRYILGRLTGKPVWGVLVGAGVTSLIQSSSATTVMVVGFVNARLMTLTQAIGVIFGANIGTTITGQLIAFKLTDYALLILAVGFFMYFFAKRKLVKNIGQFTLGFGILFLGLNLMKDGVGFLRDHPAISATFENFANKPLLGLAAGLIMTSILQSSSATIGIVIAMVSSGLLSIEEAVPIILGDNIGTCITAVLASIGTNRNARRAALAHVMFNVIGTIIIMLVLRPYVDMIKQTAVDPARQAANAHTIFNVLNTMLFLPFVPLYARLMTALIPGQDVNRRDAIYLDKRLLSTPGVAFEQAVKELARMAGFTAVSLRNIEKAIRLNKFNLLSDIDEDEEIVDDLQTQITAYLVEISERSIPADISEKIPAMLHSVNDIERIGDLCVDLKRILGEKEFHRAEFSPMANEELGVLQNIVAHALDETHRALAYGDVSIAGKVLGSVGEIENMAHKIRNNHIQRLCDGQCQIHTGVFFIEIINIYENIATRCQNVTAAIVEYLGRN